MKYIKRFAIWLITEIKNSMRDWPHFVGGILLWMIVMDRAGLVSIADQIAIYNDIILLPAFLALAWAMLLVISILRTIGEALFEWAMLEPLTAMAGWLKGKDHAR